MILHHCRHFTGFYRASKAEAKKVWRTLRRRKTRRMERRITYRLKIIT
jgi:hypothetical protein